MTTAGSRSLAPCEPPRAESGYSLRAADMKRAPRSRPPSLPPAVMKPPLGVSRIAPPATMVTPELVLALRRIAPKPRRSMLPYTFALAFVAVSVFVGREPALRDVAASRWHAVMALVRAAPGTTPAPARTQPEPRSAASQTAATAAPLEPGPAPAVAVEVSLPAVVFEGPAPRGPGRGSRRMHH